MDSSSKCLLSEDDKSPQRLLSHEGDGGTANRDTDQEKEEASQEDTPSDRKSEEHEYSNKKSVQASDQPNTTHFSSCGINRKRDTFRKSSLKFKSTPGNTERLSKKDSQTTFVLPPAGESSQGRRDPSCSSLFSHDRHSRRVRRKPSLMSPSSSQCSDYGMTRHFTQFDEASLDSARMKRDSIVSCTSVHGTILKPSIMAQGEMFSKCQRQKQWLMAIHASDPDETLPMLKKPVFLIDDGGKITKQTVAIYVAFLAWFSHYNTKMLE